MVAQTTIRRDTAERHRRKYQDRNPLQRLSLGAFHDQLAEAIGACAPRSILDFGCGEGFLLERLTERSVALDGYLGVDLRAPAIAEARARHPSLAFREADIFSYPPDGRRFDLVLASQVLEHLPSPERFLARLAALSSGRLLLTVPHEPWFRLANLARGRDIARLGNHPEHVNHWDPERFAAFVEPYARVERCWTSFPFVLLLARPR
jgi:2-polyprenyl-3-methyl-5-hydroxy-6-metoxy-1,4-benzoquinol methylase